MSIQALGYMGVRAKSVENWADYGTRQLGLQRIDKSASTLAFRMDDRKQRIGRESRSLIGVRVDNVRLSHSSPLLAIDAAIQGIWSSRQPPSLPADPTRGTTIPASRNSSA